MTEADREVLRQAARHAGFDRADADRFCDEVERRLEKGAAEYGAEGYLQRSFAECECEAIEEQHDAGGWTALGLRLLDRDVEWGFPPEVARLVRLHALQGVAFALQSERAFREAVALHAEHAGKVSPPEPPAEPPYSVCSDERLTLRP